MIARKAASLALLAGLAAGSVAAAPAGQGESLAVQVASEISTGSFDEPSGVPMRQTVLRLRYDAERWSAQAEVPWLRVAGAGQGPLAPGVRAADPEQGLGDVRLKFRLPLRRAASDATGLDLVLRLKSGSGRAVGAVDTGSAGQSLRLELLRPLGRWNVFGHMGWRRGGDLPGSEPLRPGWQGELGAYRMLLPRLEAGAFVDVRQRSGTIAPLREASVYAAVTDGALRWQVFLSRSLVGPDAPTWAGINLQAAF